MAKQSTLSCSLILHQLATENLYVVVPTERLDNPF